MASPSMIRLSRTRGVLPTAWVTSSRMGIGRPFAGTGPRRAPGVGTRHTARWRRRRWQPSPAYAYSNRELSPGTTTSPLVGDGSAVEQVALHLVERQAAGLVVGGGRLVRPAEAPQQGGPGRVPERVVAQAVDGVDEVEPLLRPTRLGHGHGVVE